MRELMLKLLTYEPFEKISGDEKEYIDAVLREDYSTSKSHIYTLYDELMFSFKKCLIFFKPKDFERAERPKGKKEKQKYKDALKTWYHNWFGTIQNGKISVIYNIKTKQRAYYPVLFKKICFFCITEFDFGDAEFLAQFNIKPNILNKWEVSPRYRKLINKDTYHSINLSRNGKKQPYLTKVIKAAFYEASRQEAVVRHFNPAIKGWMAPKKEYLLPFIDVFAGTGTVAASIDANESVVNDFDVGVACFLFCMAHDEKEVRMRLAQLHNNFVSKDLSNGASYYTSKMWAAHKQKVSRYSAITDVEYDALMIRLRNNYEEIHNMYVTALNGFSVNFANPSSQDIQSYYDIGVAWYFINAIDENGFSGHVYKVVDMDDINYYTYLETKLGVFDPNKRGIVKFQKLIDKHSGVSYKIIAELRLTASDIQFGDGKTFMKALKNAHVQCADFAQIIGTFSEGFVYEDSPYFLTTEYDASFGDKQHKIMLDMLRDADYKWLFSMQYKEFYTNAAKKGNGKRKTDQKQGQPLIKCYRDYYAGFSNDFTVEYIKKLPFYVADPDNLSDKADKLYVILFYNKSYTGEMMICNFDPRRVLPYGEEAVVIPFREFMSLPFEGGQHRHYGYIVNRAIEIREENIVNSYASGAWV